MDLNELKLEHHAKCCRLCMKPLDSSSICAGITKDVEKKFRALTTMELRLTPEFSRSICFECDLELKRTFAFITKIKSIQQRLYNFIDGTSPDDSEEILVKCEFPSDDDRDHSSEPEEEAPMPLFDSFKFFKMNQSVEKVDETPQKKARPKKGKGELKHFSDEVDKRPVCPECGLRLSDKRKLKNHIDSVHIKIKRFFCDLCGYGGTIKMHLKFHMKKHISDEIRRVHACSHCDFVSVTKQSLRIHEESEHSGIVHTCHCGKEFNHINALRAHAKRVHEKLRRHACECGKSFYDKRELENHRKIIHEPVKTLSCDICGAQFCIQKQLRNHRARHNPKFVCTVEGCGKSFIHNANLQKHLNTHTGNRVELCHLCNKSYFTVKDLKRHLDVVHKQTTFFCEFCDYSNGVKQYLGNHLKSAHNLGKEKISEVLKRVKVVKQNV